MTRLITVVLAAGACLATASCRKEAPAPKPAAPAKVSNPTTEAQLATVTLTEEAEKRLGLQTAVASVQSVMQTRTVGGEVIAPPGRSMVVSAPMAGTVRGGNVKPGSRVSAGQTLFTIFPLQDLPPEREASIEAQREAAAAGAELKAAELRLSRLEQLLKEGATSARSVEDARAQRDVLAARVQAARERASSLRAGAVGQRGEVAVRAPIAGVLQDVSVAPGQAVAAGTALFSVSQAEGLWVRVPLYVGERGDLDLSQPAGIRPLGAAAGSAIVARRVEGPPSANPSAATADLFFAATVANASLRLGERVSVELPLRQTQKGLTIPDAALLYDLQGGTWVYEALGNHAFARRRVEVAAQAGHQIVIARGIAEGTKVVTDGAAELFGTEFGAGK
jgi:membrane fusion protein, heavy metal efflux system